MELCQVAGGLAGGEVDRLEDVFVQLTSLVLRRAEPSEVVFGWRYKRNCYKLQQSLISVRMETMPANRSTPIRKKRKGLIGKHSRTDTLLCR